MNRYNDIMQGLQEALAYEKCELKSITIHHMSINEVQTFTPSEIKQIRLAANMTQSVFAAVIGVTKKAVEAWEGGRSKPDGAARRTIGLLQQNPHFAEDNGIIKTK